MTTRNGAHALVEALVAEGVETLFGIPGVDTLGVYDAFLDHSGLRAINPRHEQGAVFMADGFFRASGEIGIAVTSGGPGALNTLTAMGTAFNDSSAVLHVVNDNPAHVRRRGRGYFHDIADQKGVFRPVTDAFQQAVLASEIPSALHAAMTALKSRRPRPAMVEIAGEAFRAETDAPLLPRASADRAKAGEAEIARAAELIAAAKRPIIWSGGGVVASEGASAILLRLAERLGAPVLTSQAGKGSFPPDHELHIGNWANERPVRELIASADLVVVAGSRLSYFPTGGWSLKLPETIVQIDLDPAEIGRNYPVTLGIVSDATDGLGKLEAALAEAGHQPAFDPRAEIAQINQRIAQGVGTPVEIQVLDQIRKVLPHEAMVFNDPTTIVFWARSHWKAYRPRTWFVPSGFGTLGFALPSAIGAAVARPETPSIAMIGDSGVMFTIQDLMTAVEHNIPVKVMVFNDRGYGVERRHQDHLYGRRSGVDLMPPDFVALAHAFGATGMKAEDPGKVGETLSAAMDRPGPVLIEVPCDFKHPGYGSFVDWDNQ
ncbi:MAG: thiamine pyrophosphate-binding protein [Rhizobiales bacterium]|nr:thiamine pyrophosphate-binding protein [Hyphomicrobiales bacterium]